MAENHITKNKRFYQNFVAWLHFIVHINAFMKAVMVLLCLSGLVQNYIELSSSPLRLLQGLPWTIRVLVP